MAAKKRRSKATNAQVWIEGIIVLAAFLGSLALVLLGKDGAAHVAVVTFLVYAATKVRSWTQ